MSTLVLQYLYKRAKNFIGYPVFAWIISAADHKDSISDFKEFEQAYLLAITIQNCFVRRTISENWIRTKKGKICKDMWAWYLESSFWIEESNVIANLAKNTPPKLYKNRMAFYCVFFSLLKLPRCKVDGGESGGMLFLDDPNLVTETNEVRRNLFCKISNPFVPLKNHNHFKRHLSTIVALNTELRNAFEKSNDQVNLRKYYERFLAVGMTRFEARIVLAGIMRFYITSMETDINKPFFKKIRKNISKSVKKTSP